MEKLKNKSLKLSFLPKLKSIIVPFFLLIFLSGCELGLSDTKPTVILPLKTGISIEGVYLFEGLFNLEGEEFVDESGFLKFGAEFTLNHAKVGLEEVSKPNYVGKLVNSFDYFLEKYRINPIELEITQDKIEVVTISTPTKQFYEVFRLDENRIAIVKGSNLIKLQRASEDQMVDFTGSDKEFADGEDPDSPDAFEPRAGVLIGLKGERDKDTGDSNYRTLWITNDGELQDVYEIDDILFPRKEFWTLKVLPGDEENNKETLEIEAITGALKGIDQEFIQDYEGDSLELSFVGNNYLSLLTKEKLSDLTYETIQAMTLSLDNKNLFTPVSIGNLEGQEGETAFSISLQESIGNENLRNIDLESLNQFENNFILKRHHGNWRMVARISLEGQEVRIPIAYKPSERVVTYDDLPITWREIKRKIPQAQDAFCAPGRSFLLVRTPKYLAMYSIDANNRLSEAPLQRIEIDETDEIIMAEWARGDFVNRWTNVVEDIGQRIIFVQN